MTLYMTFELIELGRLDYATKIKMTEEGAAASPSKLGLKPGEEITVLDAIKALVTKSANDVAIALAQHIGGTEANFARLMTQKAHEIGMTQTTFKNASGLPDDGQVTTARDMLTLALRLQDDFPEHYKLFATPHLHLRRPHLPQPQRPAHPLPGNGRHQDRLHARLRLQPGVLGAPRRQARGRRRFRRQDSTHPQRPHAGAPRRRAREGLDQGDAQARRCSCARPRRSPSSPPPPRLSRQTADAPRTNRPP